MKKFMRPRKIKSYWHKGLVGILTVAMVGSLGSNFFLSFPTTTHASTTPAPSKEIISAGGSHTLGLRTDGTLWAWGFNVVGQLGLGDTTNRTSPVQVAPGTSWDQVSAGVEHTLAIRADGTLWAWGVNGFGQLGLGHVTNQTSPVQVGTGTNWSQVSAGGEHTVAIRADGTLWAWGANASGQLGLGHVTFQSSPVQVGTDTNWSQVSAGGGHTLGIRTDGTLWAWGLNAAGQLGLGDTTTQTSPVQVGTSTNWSQVSAGGEHTAAIRTDGTLWAWGANVSGQLGLGDTTHRYSPVQVGTDTNWSKVSAGSSHTLAIRTDGTLWAWGFNGAGQLGLGHTFSPREVMPMISTWGQTPPPPTPVIQNVNVTNITPNSAVINWATDIGTFSRVEYGPTPARGQMREQSANLLLTHQITLSGLTADTQYHFRVVATGNQTQTAFSPDLSFRTLALAAEPAPVHRQRPVTAAPPAVVEPEELEEVEPEEVVGRKQLQNQIQELQALIRSLETQVAERLRERQVVEPEVPEVPEVPEALTGFTFNRNLSLGATGEDVRKLQIFLNLRPETRLAEEGPGSPGQETLFFGPLTHAALIRFQEKHHTAILGPLGLEIGTGFLGPQTRIKVNGMIR